MFLAWDELRKSLRDSVGGFGELHPKFMQGYQQLDNGVAQSEHLDAKTRELIALAVAVTTRCDGCLSLHTEAAAAHGATREEIAEALAVAISLNAGVALVYSAHALEAFDSLQKP